MLISSLPHTHKLSTEKRIMQNDRVAHTYKSTSRHTGAGRYPEKWCPELLEHQACRQLGTGYWPVPI